MKVINNVRNNRFAAISQRGVFVAFKPPFAKKYKQVSAKTGSCIAAIPKPMVRMVETKSCGRLCLTNNRIQEAPNERPVMKVNRAKNKNENMASVWLK